MKYILHNYYRDAAYLQLLIDHAHRLELFSEEFDYDLFDWFTSEFLHWITEWHGEPWMIETIGNGCIVFLATDEGIHILEQKDIPERFRDELDDTPLHFFDYCSNAD
jgi:hypothetical protein